jgi:hypothetical protein
LKRGFSGSLARLGLFHVSSGLSRLVAFEGGMEADGEI